MNKTTVNNSDLSLLKQPEIVFEPFEFKSGLQINCTHLIGFEFDGTACFRKGAQFGPNAIRKQSSGIETYSPYLNADTEDIKVVDLGNLPVGLSDDVEANWKQASDYFFSITDDLDFHTQNIRFLTLGGEHSISYPPIVCYLKQYKDLLLLHLDAHADLRDGYEGYHYSHASIIRRVWEQMKDGHALFQYGIRSGTRDEYAWMKRQKTLIHSQELFLQQLEKVAEKRPIYLTLDLDYFDPAYFPGTGTPEPGGEDFHSFIQICKILQNKNLVGADVVELAPEIDKTGNSSVFAAKVVRELLLLLEKH